MGFPRRSFVYACGFIGLSVLQAFAFDLDSLHGTYYGLIDGVGFEDSGYLQISVTRTGRGTAAVKLGAESRCVVGMEWDGFHFVTVPGGDADMQITVIPVLDERGNYTVVGDLTDDGVTVSVRAAKATADAPDHAGRYTFIAGQSAAADTACGSATVSKTGNVRAVLRTRYRGAVTTSGRIDSGGKWPMFASVGRATALSGEVSFEQAGDSDCRAVLSLRAAAAPATVNTSLVGSRYISTRQPLLLLPASTPNALLTVTRGESAGYVRRVIFTERNSVIIPNAGTDKTTIRLAARSGSVSGRFFSAGVFQTLRGVIMQSRNRIEGFISGNDGGIFDVVPQAAPLPSRPQIASTSSIILGEPSQPSGDSSQPPAGAGSINSGDVMQSENATAEAAILAGT